MKTIKEAVIEYLEENYPQPRSLNRGDLTDAFLEGVAWAERWISVEEELPEEGRLVVVKYDYVYISFSDEEGKCSRIYDFAIWNGKEWQSEYFDHPTHWRPIEHGKE
jgi:hypothetical protein